MSKIFRKKNPFCLKCAKIKIETKNFIAQAKRGMIAKKRRAEKMGYASKRLIYTEYIITHTDDFEKLSAEKTG